MFVQLGKPPLWYVSSTVILRVKLRGVGWRRFLEARLRPGLQTASTSNKHQLDLNTTYDTTKKRRLIEPLTRCSLIDVIKRNKFYPYRCLLIIELLDKWRI